MSASLISHRANVSLQADMFAQRFALVQQRILRQDLFRPKLVTADGRSGDGRNVTHAITPVESLLGRAGVKFLLGMIVQVSANKWYCILCSHVLYQTLTLHSLVYVGGRGALLSRR